MKYFSVEIKVFKKPQFSIQNIIGPELLFSGMYISPNLDLVRESSRAYLETEELAELVMKVCKPHLESYYKGTLEYQVIEFFDVTRKARFICEENSRDIRAILLKLNQMQDPKSASNVQQGESTSTTEIKSGRIDVDIPVFTEQCETESEV